MALTVGELRVQLEARIRGYVRNIKKAGEEVRTFAAKTKARLAGAGKSFAGLGGAVGKVTALIGILGGALVALGLGRFVAGGVKAAATFEQIGIALTVLTGTAEGAARVLEDVNRLTVETPFGLTEVANAARSVAVVFGENTEAVSEFTAIAADVAAAFGRPIEQVGENLVRAFSSGLGAADAFRESGITASILQLTGATDVAQISGTQLAEALRQLTAEGGKAFGAAAAQAESLGGALSNTQIAAQNFQRAFGEAISPNLVAVLVDKIQPAFFALEALIRENEDAINDLAGKAFRGLIAAFKELLSFLGNVVRGVGFVVSAFQGLGLVIRAGNVLIVGLVGFLGTLVKSLTTVSSVIGRVGEGFSRALVGDFAGAAASLGKIDDDLKDFGVTAVKSLLKTNEAVDGLNKAFDKSIETRGKIDALADSLDKLVVTGADVVTTALDQAGATDDNTDSTEKNTQANLDNVAALQKRTQAQIRAQRAIENTVRIQTALASGRTSPLQKEIDVLDEQIRKTSQLSANAQDRGKQAEALNLLAARRLELTNQLNQAESVLPQVLTRVNEQIAELARFDPAAAADFATDLQRELVSAGSDPVLGVAVAANVSGALREALSDLAGTVTVDVAATQLPQTLTQINEQIAELATLDPQAATDFALQIQQALVDAGSDPIVGLAAAANISQAIREKLTEASLVESRAFAANLTGNLAGAFQDALQNGGDGFLEGFGNALLETAQDSLTQAFQDALDDVGQQIAEAFRSGSEEGILAGIGGSAVAAGVIGIVGGLISAAFQEEQVTSTAALSSAAGAAVESAQKIRGVIVGPQEVGIAQVGRSIQDALKESERLLGLIAVNTGRISGPTSNGSLATEADEAAEVLANESASFI